MSYSAVISRDNPVCLIFLVDQSHSMSQPFGLQPQQRKADGVADAINKLLQTICIKCSKQGGVREYFQVGVIGYGARVASALGGALAGEGLVSIDKIARNPLRVETRIKKEPDGAGGLVERLSKFPIWFEPVANGRTPMKSAFELARGWVAGFLKSHPHCYPPLVFNLTDGAADPDQEPTDVVAGLRQLSSTDGATLVLNLHISSRKDAPIMFPDREDNLPDEFARRLFRMSSVLPESIVDTAVSEGIPIQHGARGFGFNADLVAVIQFLEIGTRQVMNARI
uniref:VWA domain-containing protein n=1 Tax=Schlesneria paludicola TaxID=360056 RepID=A0A7C4LIZ1_9PLAN